VEPGTTHAEPTDTRSQPAHGGSAWAGPPPGPPGPPTARTTPPGHMRHRGVVAPRHPGVTTAAPAGGHRRGASRGLRL